MNSAIDNWNYANDSRTQGEAVAPTLYLDDGGEKELPMKFEVCPVCDGKGSHVNPSIDAGGLSGDMWDDYEFMEGYKSGVYDVQCNRCTGKRVVPVVDWDALTADERKAYEQQLKADREYEDERLSEIRMGC